MNKKHGFLILLVGMLSVILAACSSKPELEIEAYAIQSMDWVGESLIFKPLEGAREAILARRAAERARPAIFFTPPVKVGGDSINAIEVFTGKQAAVDITSNDLHVMTIDAGVISPINNFRGLWVVDDQWFLEVAHVEENPEDPNAALIIWGEIFADGESLNERHGYDEAFSFQILDGKPFYFFDRGGVTGFSYNGHETEFEYTGIPHYFCCSAGSFNPLPAEKMVAFYALKGEQYYYIELGVFDQ